MAEYLYRGFNLNYGDPPVLTDGTIEGSECHLIRGEVYEPHKTVAQRSAFTEVGWVDGWRMDDVAVTGGVSHYLPSTRRFRGSNGLAVVLNNDRCSPKFERVYYEWEWFDDHPGAICQILTTTDAEVRLDDKGLWGTATQQPSGKWLVDNWGKDSLPAITTDSMFADEAEWIAMSGEVAASNAVEGVVALWTERDLYISQRDSTDVDEATFDYRAAAADAYDHIRSEIPYYDGPLFLLVAPGKNFPEDTPYNDDQLEYIYDGSSYRTPESVDRKFRGWD